MSETSCLIGWLLGKTLSDALLNDRKDKHNNTTVRQPLSEYTRINELPEIDQNEIKWMIHVNLRINSFIH